LGVLVDRARQGDVAVLSELRTALTDKPSLWQACSDLAGAAEEAWLAVIGGKDLFFQEALRQRLATLRAELAGPGPVSPLERLLIAQVAACWLQQTYCDAAAAQLQGATVAQARFALERQSRARRSFLQASATLATVRRLLPAPRVIEPLARLPGRGDL